MESCTNIKQDTSSISLLVRLGISRKAMSFMACGLIFATVLIAWQGFQSVGQALSQAGFQLLWLSAIHIIPFLFATGSIAVLFNKNERPSFSLILRGNWIGTSINWLLPVAQLGGELGKAIWWAGRGVPGPKAGSAVLVDKTLQAVAQVFISVLGVGLLIQLAGEGHIVIGAIFFTLLLITGVYFFYKIQRKGFFTWLTTKAEKHIKNQDWKSLGTDAGELDRQVTATYQSLKTILNSMILRLIHRILQSVEVWLGLWLMGYSLELSEVLLLECLGQTIRSASFFVPASLGIQEGGFILLGTVVGLPAEVSLALSLAKRSREILVGLPALLYWQWSEGQLFIKTRGRPAEG